MNAKTENLALERLLRESQNRVQAALDRWLPEETIPPTRLHQAMRYATLGGGKRIRPFLVYATARALGADLETFDAPAAAVELIHTYSLIHDDLPAMDDDDLRRGQPTCHKAFDEATAILAGDSLQTLAFQVLANDAHLPVEPARRCQMVFELALAAGSRGMAGGQAMDLAAEGRTLDLVELEDLHIHKTGALIRASVRLGALGVQSCERDTLKHLDHYAKCIGLAFQIRDDILDEEGDTETLGKPRGSDRSRQKSTYPGVIGLSGAKEMASELHGRALASLDGLGDAADPLRWMATYIVERAY